MVDLKDEVFIQLNFAEEFEYIFSVQVHFEQLDEHRDEALLKEGVKTLDAVGDDFDDDRVLRSGGFGAE